MEQRYYAVLIQINIGKSVWLVPQKRGEVAWSDEISGTRVFLVMKRQSKLLKLISKKILDLLVLIKLSSLVIKNCWILKC